MSVSFVSTMPQCATCDHLRTNLLTEGSGYAHCEAFPGGIPDEVWGNDVDHRDPVEGDNGVQWAGSEYPEWVLEDDPEDESYRSGSGDDDIERRYNPAELRIPKGAVGGGRWRDLDTIIVKLLKDWAGGKGKDNPLADYDANQLRRFARDHNIPIRRRRTGETDESFKNETTNQILAAVRQHGVHETPAPVKAAKKAAPVKPRISATHAGTRTRYESRSGGEVVGYAEVTPAIHGRPGSRKVDQIRIDFSARGEGHGGALMDRIVADADRDGADLWLFPVAGEGRGDLPDLERFYRRYGFEYDKNERAWMVRPAQRGVTAPSTSKAVKAAPPKKAPAAKKFARDLPGDPNDDDLREVMNGMTQADLKKASRAMGLNPPMRGVGFGARETGVRFMEPRPVTKPELIEHMLSHITAEHAQGREFISARQARRNLGEMLREVEAGAAARPARKASAASPTKKAPAAKSLMSQMTPEHRRLARQYGLPDDHPLMHLLQRVEDQHSERDALDVLAGVHKDDVRQMGREAGVAFPVGMTDSDAIKYHLVHSLASFGSGTNLRVPDADRPAAASPVGAGRATKAGPTPDAPVFDLRQAMAEQGVTDGEIAEIRELIRIHRPPVLIGNEINEQKLARHAVFGDPKLQAFYEQHRDIYNNLVREPLADREWVSAWGTPRVDEARRTATRRIRAAVARSPVVIRQRDESSLMGILRDGRVKSQFETGTSSGYVDKALRADYEQMAFGAPLDMPESQRPVYGYVAVGGLDADRGQRLAQFGEIRVVLRDSARKRATVSAGDSLDQRKVLQPLPIGEADWHAVQPSLAERDFDTPQFRDAHYVEAQIHGGVTVDDIEEVVFSSPPSPALARQLEASRVKYRVLAPPGGAGRPAKAAANLGPPVAGASLTGRSIDDLRAIASAEGIAIPPGLTVEELRKLISAHRKASFSPNDLAERLTGLPRNATQADVMRVLGEARTLPELRRVARELNIGLPATSQFGSTGLHSTPIKMTAAQLREYIAKTFLAERGRFQWR